jgi:hypothetical protein
MTTKQHANSHMPKPSTTARPQTQHHPWHGSSTLAPTDHEPPPHAMRGRPNPINILSNRSLHAARFLVRACCICMRMCTWPVAIAPIHPNLLEGAEAHLGLGGRRQVGGGRWGAIDARHALAPCGGAPLPRGSGTLLLHVVLVLLCPHALLHGWRW